MDAQSVADIARDMAMASRVDALSRVFLDACLNVPGMAGACLYARDATGDRLFPLVQAGSAANPLPDISMDTLDNPLV